MPSFGHNLGPAQFPDGQPQQRAARISHFVEFMLATPEVRGNIIQPVQEHKVMDFNGQA